MMALTNSEQYLSPSQPLDDLGSMIVPYSSTRAYTNLAISKRTVFGPLIRFEKVDGLDIRRGEGCQNTIYQLGFRSYLDRLSKIEHFRRQVRGKDADVKKKSLVYRRINAARWRNKPRK